VGSYGSFRPTRRRVVPALALAAATVALSGCSADLAEQWRRGGLPEPAAEETPLMSDLWIGAWIAALVIGVIVWGLILFSMVAFRRRSDSLPPQTRYNLPIEFFYTVAPFMVIAALFYFTARNEDEMLETSENPDVRIGVVGQQWSWTFNYLDADVYDVGTAVDPPTLVLPVDQTVRFDLSSPDVIHSFWVPSFYFKMDVVPGRDNFFELTPNREGTFAGKCAEYCGAYHSRMLFSVEVVSQEEFEEHLDGLREAGQTGEIEAPLRGSYSTGSLGQNEPDPGQDENEPGSAEN
jgi:cytochrome c oxidase subunit 2